MGGTCDGQNATGEKTCDHETNGHSQGATFFTAYSKATSETIRDLLWGGGRIAKVPVKPVYWAKITGEVCQYLLTPGYMLKFGMIRSWANTNPNLHIRSEGQFP